MASQPSCGSPRARWRSTCAASWPSCGCRRRPTITAACWRCSRIWIRAEQLVDRGAREHRLGDEPGGRARLEQLLEVGLGVGRDQDRVHRLAELDERAGDVDAVLGPEVDVDE